MQSPLSHIRLIDLDDHGLERLLSASERRRLLGPFHADRRPHGNKRDVSRALDREARERSSALDERRQERLRHPRNQRP